MESTNFGRTVAVGIGLALAASIPAASQAREVVAKHQVTSAHRQAEAASYGARQARHKALDGIWNVAPRRYLMH
jgi:hypothetical protein